MAVSIGSCAVAALGRIRCALPQVPQRTPVRIALALVDGQGRTIAEHAVDHEVWPSDDHAGSAVIIGRRGGPAERLAMDLGLHPLRRRITGRALVLVDDAAAWAGHASLLEEAVQRGAHALILASTPGSYRIAGDDVSVHEHHMGRLHFVSRATSHPFVAGLRAKDVHWWHDADAGIVTPLCHAVATAPPGWKEVLTSGNCGWGVPRSPAAACLERQLGSGRIVFNQVLLSGRTKTNPAAQLLALRLAGLAVVGPDAQLA